MTFFEQELKKITDHSAWLMDTRFIGNTCYGRVTDDIRAKINFVCPRCADTYTALRITMLNRIEGRIDSVDVAFRDLWGIKKTNNPNFVEGISPYIWSHNGEAEWYVYHPISSDYRLLAQAVDGYLELFQEPVQALGEQKMF